jgi:tight adherence protein B
MTLLAALCTGAAVYLAVGLATGAGPSLRRTRAPRSQVSPGQLWLVQAGAALTPRQFWAGSTALGIAVLVLVSLATATPAVAVVPAAAAAALPRVLYARQRTRRLRAVQEAWPDALRELVAGIAAGMSLSQALGGLATGGPPAIQAAFAGFPSLIRTVGVVPALELVKEELADPTSDRVIEVLVLAHERGGRIVADLLRDLAEATTDDLRVTEQITTEALEQRLNGRAVLVLPWLVLLLLTARPGHFRDFYQSSAGLAVVLLGGLLSLIGVAVLGRLATEPVEERVLGGAAPVAGERP